MNQSEQLGELATALAKAQGEMHGAAKDSNNPFFKSSYADLASIWNACRLPLSQNGLAVIQTLEVQEYQGVISNSRLVTTLTHSSGQWIRGSMHLNPVKNDPQGMGSAISYARRYSLAAIVGVVQVDDDGEAAQGRKLELPRVSPDPLHPEDGSHFGADLSYRIPFGKFKSRTLEEVGPNDLKSYYEYLEAKAEKEGKPITGVVEDFMRRAAEFIGYLENEAIQQMQIKENWEKG